MAKADGRAQVNDYERCNCNSKPNRYIDPVTGDELCLNCGVVFGERAINTGADWKVYDKYEAQKRVHAEPLRSFPNTFSYIDKNDGKGRPLKLGTMYFMRRIRRWASEIDNRSYYLSVPYVLRICSQLKLDESSTSESLRWYKVCIYNNMAKGRSIEGAAAASVRLACRINNKSIKLNEIVEEAGAKKKDVNRIYNLLKGEANKRGIKIESNRPQTYVNRFLKELELPDSLNPSINMILELAENRNITGGRDPKGIAGAVIYIVAKKKNERRSQKDISKVVGVAEATIRNRYKELVDKLDMF